MQLSSGTVKKKTKNSQDLRWGFSTGASMSALALCAWHSLNTTEQEQSSNAVLVYFLDGVERFVPVLSQEALTHLKRPITLLKTMQDTTAHSAIVALYKDGGDDPDCTHKALLYARLSKASLSEASEKDYLLQINNATLIIQCIEGIGICTREGLDCEKGKWAISIAPRNMLKENLCRANMQEGVWLLQIGVQNGQKLAKSTLNSTLGVIEGISLLGTTGLVRPYSHEAYLDTIRICVKSHAIACAKGQIQEKEMVFCTGGRTKKGAQKYLPHLPETAFTPIGDFIAESFKIACQYDMQIITIACMAGKLCKYASGFTNTHAHKVQQDMDLLWEELEKCLSHTNIQENIDKLKLKKNLEKVSSVREALIFLPEEIQLPLLKQLSVKALGQFRSWCGTRPSIKLLVFDFAGEFLFEEQSSGDNTASFLYPIIDLDNKDNTDYTQELSHNSKQTDSTFIVDKNYFLASPLLKKSSDQSSGGH